MEMLCSFGGDKHEFCLVATNHCNCLGMLAVAQDFILLIHDCIE